MELIGIVTESWLSIFVGLSSVFGAVASGIQSTDLIVELDVVWTIAIVDATIVVVEDTGISVVDVKSSSEVELE